jgi:hypothetical protein
MADDPLQSACREACEALSQAPVALTRDTRGRRAFGLRLGQVDLSVLHLPGEPAGTLHVLADVAPSHEGRPWGPLMDINRWLLPLSGGVLCRHPDTGGVLLRARVDWPGAANGFVDEIRALAAMAGDLRTFCGTLATSGAWAPEGLT